MYSPRVYWSKRFLREGVNYVARHGRQSDYESAKQALTFWDAISVLLKSERDCLLDFGCGTGRLSSNLAARARRYVGVDICEGAILQTPTISNATFEHLASEHIPYGDGHFDSIVCVTVLQHIVDDSDWSLWCSELRRVCVPFGQFVIVDDASGGPTAEHMRVRLPHDVARDLGGRIGGHLHAVSADGQNSHWAYMVNKA